MDLHQEQAGNRPQKPQMVFGAVYYRRTNPPREDWERDYQQAAADGMNTFRHWFLWGALEVAPGVFNWEPYDRQMELAAKNGIKTIIAEVQSVPEWLYHQRPDLLGVRRDGSRPDSALGNSTAAGGFVEDWLCPDHPEARQYAGNFLRELAKHYRGHPGLYGYDVMNECHYSRNLCYCQATQQRFREWLLKKYGSLAALGEAWHRYSFTDWEQVRAPRIMAQFPECIDWMEFCKERAYENMQWRIEQLRSGDPDAWITAHGLAGSLDTARSGSDDWMAAQQVESYGLTWVACRKGNQPWKQWHAVDLTRSAARGKDFWHAEMQGGPLWLQPQVVGRPKEDGRVADEQDVRLWSMTSLAAGARGLMWTRWRGLLDGPLFEAFGLYSMDGSPNSRSEMASKIGKWANLPSTAGLMASRPVQGEIGIVVLDSIQEFSQLMQQAGEGRFYTRCMQGAYRAFFDQNIQADWVHFDDMDQYRILYFPYPIHLTQQQAKRLADWVEKGGRLFCEGMPGFFGEGGHVGTVQPGQGLDRLFGARQQGAEFMPDLGDQISFDWLPEGWKNLPGGLFRQSYSVTSGEVLGYYPDGTVAAVEHQYGSGKALLVGTFPSEAYSRCPSEELGAWFASLLKRAGTDPIARCSAPGVIVRVSEDKGSGRRYLWAVNHNREELEAELTLRSPARCGEVLWGNPPVQLDENRLSVRVSGRDCVIFSLEA